MGVAYEREGAGLEFDRVAFFTDAVFAIAFTLLVVEVGIPELGTAVDAEDASALFEALVDKVPVLIAFFIGCFVIGSYWMAHHRFLSRVARVDQRFVALTVLYLSFVALLPFPTALLGEYFDNPVSILAFALNAAAVSTMEAVLFHHAARARLFRLDWPPDVVRWALVMSLSPVVLFLVSIPVAFVATWLAVVVWALALPLQLLLSRWQPADTDTYLD